MLAQDSAICIQLEKNTLVEGRSLSLLFFHAVAPARLAPRLRGGEGELRLVLLPLRLAQLLVQPAARPVPSNSSEPMLSEAQAIGQYLVGDPLHGRP